jgi:hypothetical protein
MFKIEMLSIIAATELFGASNGVAADVDIRSHNKDVTATGGSDDVKMPENRASQLQMVDSEGKSISSPRWISMARRRWSTWSRTPCRGATDASRKSD